MVSPVMLVMSSPWQFFLLHILHVITQILKIKTHNCFWVWEEDGISCDAGEGQTLWKSNHNWPEAPPLSYRTPYKIQNTPLSYRTPYKIQNTPLSYKIQNTKHTTFIQDYTTKYKVIHYHTGIPYKTQTIKYATMIQDYPTKYTTIIQDYRTTVQNTKHAPYTVQSTIINVFSKKCTTNNNTLLLHKYKIHVRWNMFNTKETLYTVQT